MIPSHPRKYVDKLTDERRAYRRCNERDRRNERAPFRKLIETSVCTYDEENFIKQSSTIIPQNVNSTLVDVP